MCEGKEKEGKQVMNTCVKEKKKKENKAQVSEFVLLSKFYFHFLKRKNCSMIDMN